MGISRPKYQVFVSSTFADLHVEREAVIWTILTARHIPAGMESFTATDDRGWQTIKSVIDRADYYILILAGRYGSLDENGISWTEREYGYAISKKIPALVFIRDSNFIVSTRIDDDPKLAKKLEVFKKRVRDRHHCVSWTTKEDLIGRVSGALTNHILDDEDSRTPRPGWYRGDELPKNATLDEFARLSNEAMQAKSELAALRATIAETPFLALEEASELPVSGKYRGKRILRSYVKSCASISEMIASDRDGFVMNSVVFLEFGIRNLGKKLVEHVIVDMKFSPTMGFQSHLWTGSVLSRHYGRLFSSGIKNEHKSRFPDSARLDNLSDLSMRFRVPYISIGGIEYLPPIRIVGHLDGELVRFKIKYSISSNVGNSVDGECIYEVEFDGDELIDQSGKYKDVALFKGNSDIMFPSELIFREN